MDKKKQWLRYLPVALGGVLALLIAVGVYFLKDLFQKPAQVKKQVQQITVVQPPPPPPPPPEVKPPEPEVKEEKIEEPKPEPEPEPEAKQEDAPPPGEELGVDGEGGAGSDAFGLVGKKGGRGLIGGGGGNAIIWYGGQISKGLEKELDHLLETGRSRQAGYSVLLNVWVDDSGRVNRVELNSSSGKPEVDGEIKTALARLSFSLQKPPPEDMPQPLKIRFTSRI
jgi:TonB family protein